MGISGIRFNLRGKLLFAPLLALFIAFSLSGFLISQRVGGALLANEDAQISMSSKILSELFVNRLTVAKTALKEVVVMEELGEAYFVATNEDDFTDMGEVLARGMENAGAQETLVFNRDGSFMYRSHPDQPDYSHDFKDKMEAIIQHPPITDPQNELDQVVHTILFVEEDELYLATVGPFLDVEDIVGVVAFIKKLDTPFIAEIKADLQRRFFGGKSLGEVSLSKQNGLAVTTLEGLTLPIQLIPGKNYFDLDVQDQPFRHLFLSLDSGPVFLGLSYDVSENTHVRRVIRNIMMLIFALALALVCIIILLNANWIASAVRVLVNHAQQIAQGNLVAETAEKASNDPDELGQLSRAINAMAVSLSKTIRTVLLQSDTVEVCVSELGLVKEGLGEDSRKTHAIAGEVVHENELLNQEINSIQNAVSQVSTNLDTITDNAVTLSESIFSSAAATEQASVNVATVAAAAEQMSANLNQVNSSLGDVNQATQSVAGAANDMTQSFEQVRSICQEGIKFSERTGVHANESSEIMQRLHHSAMEIGSVVSLIQSIADQTKILSLNAGIEAASAGAAGKEFHVVAVAVKDLARKTTEASYLIAEKIEGIQKNALDASSSNQAIGTAVQKLNTSIQGISQSVDQQTALVRKITDAMDSVVESVGTVTLNSEELGLAAQDVSRAAGEATIGAQEIATTTALVATSASEMHQQSEKARQFVKNTLISAENTAKASLLVKEKMEYTFRLADYLQGSVNHFEKLTGVVQGSSKSLRDAQAGLDVGPPPFDVRQEKQYHLQWLGKLEQFLRGRETITVGSLPDGKSSPFDQWYSEEGSLYYQGITLFVEVGTLRDTIRDRLNQVVTLGNKGQIDQAKQEMKLLNDQRKELFTLLDHLYHTDMSAANRDANSGEEGEELLL